MDILVSAVADVASTPLATIGGPDVAATYVRVIDHAETGVQTADFESSI